MGFSYRGAVRSLDKANERKRQREEFLQELMAKRQAVVLPYLMERWEAQEKARLEKRARLSEATSLGFSKEAAAILESNGQLTSLNDRLRKLVEDPQTDLSQAGMKKLSQAIVDNVPEDKVAAAMTYAFDTGVAANPTTEGLISVMNATTDEELFSAMQAAVPSPTIAPTISTQTINLQGATELSPTKATSAFNFIQKQLAPLIGGTSDGQGGYVFQNPTAAGRIINNAFEVYKVKRQDPLFPRDDIDIISDIEDRLTQLTQGGSQLNEIADNPGFELTVPSSTPAPEGLDDDEDPIESSFLPPQ